MRFLPEKQNSSRLPLTKKVLGILSSRKYLLGLLVAAALMLVQFGEVGMAKEEKETYELTLIQTEHGKIELEGDVECTEGSECIEGSVYQVRAGSELTIKAAAEDGYCAEEILLCSQPCGDEKEKREISDGKAVFVMPDKDVSATVLFENTGQEKEGAQTDSGTDRNSGDSVEAKANSKARSGGQIVSAYIKKGASVPGGIDVTRWDGDQWTGLDHWSEGVLGSTSGERLFCANPKMHFKEGVTLTSHDAREYYSQDTINTVCGILYYVDETVCPKLTEDQVYMLKQAFVWTVLNETSKWYTGGDYITIDYGNGLVCGCGYNVAGHYNDYLSGGREWIREHKKGFTASGEIFTNGKDQPLARFTYDYNPKGKLILNKESANEEMTEGNSCYSFSGAQYGVYTEESCKTKAGTLTVKEDGKSNTLELMTGTYYIREIKAPSGYALDTEVYKAEITADETTKIGVRDIPQSGPVTIVLVKTDADMAEKGADTPEAAPQGGAVLENAEFTVKYYDGYYDADPETLGKKAVRSWVLRTDEKGQSLLDEEYKVSGDSFYKNSKGQPVLPLGTVTVRETKAPKGYQINGEVFIRQITGQGTDEDVLTYNRPTIEEDIIRGGVLVEKWDNETGKNEAQGGASLKGAKFQIISENENAVVVNGKKYGKGEVVRTIETDGEGRASTAADELPFGTYTVRETEPPEGYKNTGVTERKFEIRENGVLVRMASALEAIRNDVIRGDLQIVKFREDVDEEEDQKTSLKGIVFTVTSKTTGEKTEITTDENGYASTKGLSETGRGGLVYDTYIVSESNTPEGLKPADDFEVTIEEEGRTLYYILENKQILSPVRLVKTDGTTGQPIPLAGVEFRLLDENKEPVKMTVHYPQETVYTTFCTDESGSFVLPEKLPAGTYYFEEIKAPEGYILMEGLMKFEIEEGHDWEEPFSVEFENIPAKGRLHIKKSDSVTGGGIEGTVFEIRAKEDIVTADGTVRVKKGEKADTVTTDAKGIAQSKELFLGTYEVTETVQSEGYAHSDQPYEAELRYKDQNTEIVTEKLEIENIPTTVIIEKTDKETKEPLEGVEFTLWKQKTEEKEEETKGGADTEETDPEGSDTEEADTEGADAERSDTEEAEKQDGQSFLTDEDGKIVIRGLGQGTYEIQETKSLTGFMHNSETYQFTVDEKGRIEGQEEITFDVQNVRTKIADTNAYWKEHKAKTIKEGEDNVILDKVNLKNLTIGQEYRLTGILADKETGERLKEKEGSAPPEKKFTAESSEQTVSMDFEINSEEMGDREIVVFEYLYEGETLIDSHEDIEDEGQTVSVLKKAEAAAKTGDDTDGLRESVLLAAFSLSGIMIAGFIWKKKKLRQDKEKG